VREELDVAIELGPLVGVYSSADSRIVLIVYAARTGDRPRTTEEASEVAAFDPAGIPWEELAFWSTRAALEDFLAARR
jgi:ADP-ribose pyrophosphatase YjhB (NUDIX family)